jgi:hypothetical protein
MSKLNALLGLVLIMTFIGARAESMRALRVGFITKESQKFYDDVVKPYWTHLNETGPLELISLSTYRSDGSIDLEKLAKNIRQAPPEMKTIYVHWNEKYAREHQAWVEALREKTQKGVRVAFFAGLASPGVRSVPLSQTIASQVPKSLILGELLERERLPAHHFYGPELFSAFKSESVGMAGLAPLGFVRRWAQQKPDQSLEDSLSELRRKKMKSLRMWPTTEDFFGRGR